MIIISFNLIRKTETMVIDLLKEETDLENIKFEYYAKYNKIRRVKKDTKKYK